ncbi:hypothetical protein HDV57DRAFT_513822 [Trichoderma longibrachiatum]|uniref:Uncharacterized protein n=1 Tax=Trichoderma longibrachiatum ATCC 18648 TaxID=983965 RepID=A0A2T4CCR6_TRILO|nr:hypothetical protein M440DRAFT_1327063 [Trichoderma longibrachiatum ATCC 18648]
MKDIKDAECGVVPQKKMGVARKIKENLLDFKFMTSAGMSICALAALLAITFLAAHCAGLERLYQAHGAVIVASDEAIPVVDHKLERRAADCNETESAMSAASAQVVTLVLDDGSLAVVTQDSVSYSAVSVTSIPISTQTATSTIYSIITPSTPAVVTKTLTMTTSMFTSEAPICSAIDTTVTVTVTVQPAPSPWASSSVLGDVTVTGGASTVTNVNTDVSYTSGLPDATVSGNPSTVTNVDVSVTNLPDVTVSGNPATVTNLLTDISLTSGLPDATVSGSPSTITAIQTSYSLPREPVTSLVTVVISDLWSPPASSPLSTDLVTVTAVSTLKTTVTTIGTAPSPIIVTVQPPYVEPTSTTTAFDSSKAGAETFGQSTLIKTVTATTVQSATSTTTVFMTPVVSSYNGTAASTVPVGTAASSSALPSIPVVVSGGNNMGNEAQGRILAGSILAVAAVMAVL